MAPRPTSGPGRLPSTHATAGVGVGVGRRFCRRRRLCGRRRRPVVSVNGRRSRHGGLGVQVLYGVNQRLRMEDVDSPLANIRPVKKVTVCIVTGDRGLCGGYNAFAIKKARAARAAQPGDTVGHAAALAHCARLCP